MNLYKHIVRDAKGAAAIEFALVLPVLILLLLGAFDITRYMLIIQKVDKAASLLGHVVSQSVSADNCTPPTQAPGVINRAGINAMINRVLSEQDGLLAPYSRRTGGLQDYSLYITSFSKIVGQNTPRAHWQINAGRFGFSVVCNGGGCNNQPVLGSTPAQFLNGQMNDNENVIAVELSQIFNPVFGNFLMGIIPQQVNVRRDAFYPTRNGTLRVLPAGPNQPCP